MQDKYIKKGTLLSSVNPELNAGQRHKLLCLKNLTVRLKKNESKITLRLKGKKSTTPLNDLLRQFTTPNT